MSEDTVAEQPEIVGENIVVPATGTDIEGGQPAQPANQAKPEGKTVKLTKNVRAWSDEEDQYVQVEASIELLVVDQLPFVTTMEFGAVIAGIESGQAEDAEFAYVFFSAIKDALKPGQYQRFRKWSIDVEAGREDFLGWSGQIIGDAMGRPTKGQSSSPAGLPATSNGSTAHGDSTTVTPASSESGL